ncbi:hypothetical protein AgCh_013007 [Apium graveolens]
MVAKRILRYIKGTLSHGLFYSHSQNAKLVGYSDSDYGGDLDDGKSTSGYAFHIGSVIFSWSSKKQQTVALSTCEAEYIAAAALACQAIWLGYVLGELNLVKEEPWIASNSSFASITSSSMSFSSVNFGSAPGTNKNSGTQFKSTTDLPLPSSSVSGNHDTPELFDTVFASQTVTSSTSDSDLFQSPKLSSNLPIDLLSSDLPMDLFQPSSTSLTLTVSCPELSPASQPSSSDQESSMRNLNETSLNLVKQQYGVWETFDGPQNMDPSQGSQSFTGAEITLKVGGSVSDADQQLFQNETQQCNAFYDSSTQVTYSSMPIHWHGSQRNSVNLSFESNQVRDLASKDFVNCD